MGGGGGDGGYEARQAAVEASKTEARRRLNATFGEGVGPVDRAKYTTQRAFDPTFVPDELATVSQYGDDAGVGARMSVSPLRVQQYGGEGDASGIASSAGGRWVGGGYEDVFDQKGYDEDVALTNASGGVKAAREKLYGTVRDNAYTAGKRGLDESRDRASRDLRFELFAKGLNGGSEDVNQNALLGRTYSGGLLDLGAKADAAATSLRTSDEQTRLNLLQGIDSGMDQGSVLSSAATQLSNNGAAASAAAQGTSLGDLFANAGLLSQQSQYRQGKAAGTDWWNSLAPGNATARAKASGGTITQS